MTAGVACASCGTGLRENAKFCDECGAHTTVSGVPTEYKQVTALFADVVRSMDIAATLDVERLREVMTDLVERAAAVARRYGGTVEFTGDGVMAIFGAPVAFEDHAFRACLAALEVQRETEGLAADVRRRDGVALRLRVGLNSGRVIAGDIGSGSLGYAAIGEHVGLAQRMESAAPPGGVMLSEATARLVEHVAVLAEPEWVHVKGADEPMRARLLVEIEPRHAVFGRAEAHLVGRRWEMAVLEALVDRSIGGRGGVVNVVGLPGIGKSRVAREAAALATRSGVDVFWTFCESHAGNIPFHVVAQLFRAARDRVRAQGLDVEPEDLLLFDDLLGIADPDVPLPQIDPDARRRRLTALIRAAVVASEAPALYIIEDAQWIDAVSESMLADLLAVVPRTPSTVLITHRPEYWGHLRDAPGARSIALGPLSDSNTAALLGELLGSDGTVGELSAVIADRAAGNPFFAEEMVRELVQRGVLTGEHGDYACRTRGAEVTVPATVQAAIAARIDQLSTPAKQTLYAASVIGVRFGAQLLTALDSDPVVGELAKAELIDQVSYAPGAEYAFRHPLIRAVAYESQLKSDRAEVHRRLAAAIESGRPESADQNAALIAEHLQAAGDEPVAFAWHMRAGAWFTNREIAAARVSWERARQIADALPAGYPGRTEMRIAPRTMLCGTGWRVDAHIAGHFDDLRELCAAAGDKASLALGMTGMVMEHMMQGRMRDASRLASEQLRLLESIADPALTVAAGFMAILMKYRAGAIADVLRWSQNVIDWADGDPTKGNIVVGSPLAMALVWRGVARFWLGLDGWRQDLDDATGMARRSDVATHTLVVFWKHGWTITNGVLVADAKVLRELDEALRVAERSGDDTALGLARYVSGIALWQQDDATDHQRGLELLGQVREMCLHHRFYRSELPGLDAADAVEKARRGDLDGAIPVIRNVADGFFEAGQLGYGAATTAFLVEALLGRGKPDDVSEAENAIDRAARLPADDGLVLRDVWLLRLRALLARARGDDASYRDLAGRYRERAESLGFEGHLASAEMMIVGTQ